MFSKLSLQPLSRLAAVLSLAAVAALPAGAQEQAQATAPVQVQAQPVASSQSAMQNLELYSSSATTSQDDAVTNERESLNGSPAIGPNADADPQYGGGYGGPPRRRPYGRPTYKDRWTNSDGSSKFAFEAGVGPVTAAGATGHYSRTGVDVSLGLGRNFSRAFGVLFQYDYAHMGVVNSVANNFICGSSNCNGSFYQGTGATHLWSLTVNPIINFSDPHSHYGAYIVAGGGFYRKMTVFNVTDAFGNTYGCGGGNGLCFSNNALGANGGLGFFYKLTDDGNAKVFAEARYVWVDNQASVNNTAANGGFPQTNQRTGYFPVTIGVRF